MKVRNSEGYMDLVPHKAILNVKREKKTESKSAFRPLVYICAPFSGNIEGRPGTSHRGFVRSFGQRQKKSGRLGKKLYLEGDLLAEAEKMQQSAMEVDERVGMVEEYLNTMLPDDWDSMDLFQRRNYLSGSEFGSPVHEAKELRTEVSNAEIWCECFDKSLQELKPTDSYSIAALMSQIGGWERTTTIKRQPIYGRQRLYKFGG